tara:strand:+ start:3200 stop:3787 length:588 start_codon:yes stop_codon:yes gene_type:complete
VFVTEVRITAETETAASDSPESSLAPKEEFIKLFTRYQRRVFLFILSQVPNPVDAEEIHQETNVIIWRKFDRFELGTNFLAWACQIANYEVLKFRSRQRRDRHLFSDEFVRQVASDAIEQAEDLEQRRQYLAACLGKLRSNDRELIQQRYSAGESGKSVAELIGRPTNSVYQSLSRIRRTLLECVNRQIRTQATP